ncbi:hypothetical protein GW17_00004657 [Ensete ventricosum]|nr:hypothetical protein GW17_00004657 [Ensete ventricosum]
MEVGFLGLGIMGKAMAVNLLRHGYGVTAITKKGGYFLEAPVSGSKKPAEDGQLVILAAGEKDLGAIANPMFKLKGPAMIKGSYPPAFPLKHQQKDMRLALALGDENAVSMPIAAASNEAFKKARSLGLGDLDFSAVFEAVKSAKDSDKMAESDKTAAERRVCVTGGNGFIGSWIVRGLLAKGYAVTATYHPASDPSHLRSLPGGDDSQRLVLRPADLLDAEAIASAVAGCRAGVIHVASPCTLEAPRDPERDLVAPAVEGTLNVLEAARAAGASRVVITASISSMVPNPRWALDHPGRPVDEECWTDLDYCKAHQVRSALPLPQYF